jgi:hypothetical protein
MRSTSSSEISSSVRSQSLVVRGLSWLAVHVLLVERLVGERFPALAGCRTK